MYEPTWALLPVDFLSVDTTAPRRMAYQVKGDDMRFVRGRVQYVSSTYSYINSASVTSQLIGIESLTIEVRGLLDSSWALRLAADDKLRIPVNVVHIFKIQRRYSFAGSMCMRKKRRGCLWL